MAGSTKKRYSGSAPEAVDSTQASKGQGYGNQPGKYTGQLKGGQQTYAEPRDKPYSAKIRGMDGLHNDIGEMSGFITDGYLDKQDTPYGEAAKFNQMPPGMDISNQPNVEIHAMPMRILVEESYPGDGWTPTPRDIPE